MWQPPYEFINVQCIHLHFFPGKLPYMNLKRQHRALKLAIEHLFCVQIEKLLDSFHDPLMFSYWQLCPTDLNFDPITGGE